MPVAVTSLLFRVGTVRQDKDGVRQTATLQPSMTLHYCPSRDILEHMKLLRQREMPLFCQQVSCICFLLLEQLLTN
jgi:hypothetical protein